MKKFVIILAGGVGKRMGLKIPKQFFNLNGKPILAHTIEKFFNYDNNLEIIVVIPENQVEFWKKIIIENNFTIKHKIVHGGSERFFSVKNAVDTIKEKSLIAVHDGVRPFVSNSTLERCFKTAEIYGNAVPVIDLKDSIRKIKNGNNFSKKRENYKLVQTPQIFQSEILKKAYSQNYKKEFTDDASLIENLKKKIFLTDGNKENIKITDKFDLIIAENLYKNKNLYNFVEN